MSRVEDHEELSALADQYEPEMQARYERAAKRMHAGVNLDRLTLALAKGDREAALRAAVTDTGLRKAMAPVETLIKTTLVRVGHLGARILNRLPQE